MKKNINIDFIGKYSQARDYQLDNPNKRLMDLLTLMPARFESEAKAREYSECLLKDIILNPVDLPEGSLKGTSHDCFCGLSDEINQISQQSSMAQHPISPHYSFKQSIRDDEAVKIAYGKEMKTIAEYLRNHLSVLVICDRILTEFIYPEVCRMAGKTTICDTSMAGQTDQPSKMEQTQQAINGGPSDLKKNLQILLNNQQTNELIVIRTLEMLDNTDMIELVYRNIKEGVRPQLLGFIDPSIEVQKVLTDRFAVHVTVMGLSRYIKDVNGQNTYTVSQLITEKEHHCFTEYQQEDLFKKVAGLNAIQFRHAMQYVSASVFDKQEPKKVFELILNFKKSTSEEIEIPTIRFEDIGGYEEVKHQLKRMIRLIDSNVGGMEPEERLKLIPRGFIFHGPPGTGKTLFAKAIANEMNATIQMVSGPEIMDKYVGQSENNLRRIFSTARRNAPSVIFFDEFDSIASQRSTYSDGAARSNNAVVAQLLTELDGFREDQTVIVIGTSNRLDIIDQALLRPSRLRPVEIKRPDHAARKEVAGIHAKKFGVNKLITDLFTLVKSNIQSYQDNNNEIPESFYQMLYSIHPPYEYALDQEKKHEQFKRELEAFFCFVQNISQVNSSDPDDFLVQFKEKLIAMGKNYGMVLSDIKPSDILKDQPYLTRMQSDIKDIFSMIINQEQKGLSLAHYYSATLELIAEYTNGFNNDEIRSVFQEASLAHHMEGQLVTPRYLSQLIGLIQKRRDEREAMREK